MSNDIKKVGVFVDAPMDQIILQLYENDLDLIQLHGEEDPVYCKHLKQLIDSDKQVNVEIIKAFSIDEAFDFRILDAYEDVCDYYLFDTKGELPGGTGKSFDWRLLRNYPSSKPFLLSGGIGPEDAEAIKDFLQSPEASHCIAIDVNSRFEKEPGLKNIEDLQKFIDELGF